MEEMVALRCKRKVSIQGVDIQERLILGCTEKDPKELKCSNGCPQFVRRDT